MPVQSGGGRDDIQIYQKIIQFLTTFGQVLTEHLGLTTLTADGEVKTENFIYNRDLNWLTEAEVVVAEVTTPSLGVGYEIAKAEELGKKILCLFYETDERKLSAMIAGNDKNIIGRYKTLKEAENIIKNFFKS